MSPLLANAKAAILQGADQSARVAADLLITASSDVRVSVNAVESPKPRAVADAVAKSISAAFARLGADAPQGPQLPHVLPVVMAALTCEALAALEEVGGSAITPEFLAECTRVGMANVLILLGITPARVRATMRCMPTAGNGSKARRNGLKATARLLAST